MQSDNNVTGYCNLLQYYLNSTGVTLKLWMVMIIQQNVSTFHQLYAACEQILFLRFDKKHKRYLYCVILWSKLQICS